MFCVLILYISEGTFGLKSTPNDRFFFEELFMAIFIYSQSFCQKSAERKSLKKYFSYFVLMSGFSSNKPTHYLIDHGIHIYNIIKMNTLFAYDKLKTFTYIHT